MYARVCAATTVAAMLIGHLLAATPPPTRSRPDFSGTWLNQSDANATDVSVAATLPFALLTIRHQDNRFELRTSGYQAPSDEVHICDGRENTNTFAKGVLVERTNCSWNASDVLIIEGTIVPRNGFGGVLRYAYSLDKDGVLVVERRRQITQSSAGPRKPIAWISRYKKVVTP